MPGFFVSDGAYPNTTSPNPSCCSDPGVLCRDCAKLALTAPAEKYFDWDACRDNWDAARAKAKLTANCSWIGAGGGPAMFNRRTKEQDEQDVRDMTPPTLLDLLRNERNEDRDEEEALTENSLGANADCSDVRGMTPPSLVDLLADERRRERRKDRPMKKPLVLNLSADEQDVRDMSSFIDWTAEGGRQ